MSDGGECRDRTDHILAHEASHPTRGSTRKWGRERDSNPRPSAHEADELTRLLHPAIPDERSMLSLRYRQLTTLPLPEPSHLVAPVGLEPTLNLRMKQVLYRISHGALKGVAYHSHAISCGTTVNHDSRQAY